MTLKELEKSLQTIDIDKYGDKEVFVDMTGFGIHLSPIEEIAYNPRSVNNENDYVGITISGWDNSKTTR